MTTIKRMTWAVTKLPEIIDAFIPDLVRNLRLSAGRHGICSCRLYVRAVAAAAMRPTGLGQVRRGWRPVLWFVLLAVVLYAD
jgi:hypothetical protein